MAKPITIIHRAVVVGQICPSYFIVLIQKKKSVCKFWSIGMHLNFNEIHSTSSLNDEIMPQTMNIFIDKL